MAMKATAEAQALQRSRRLPVSAWSVRREAEAIRARVLRKRRPWRKKALAYQKYNNAAMAEMLINVLA